MPDKLKPIFLWLKLENKLCFFIHVVSKNSKNECLTQYYLSYR